jgi:hypothetical protein
MSCHVRSVIDAITDRGWEKDLQPDPLGTKPPYLVLGDGSELVLVLVGEVDDMVGR